MAELDFVPRDGIRELVADLSPAGRAIVGVLAATLNVLDAAEYARVAPDALKPAAAKRLKRHLARMRGMARLVEDVCGAEIERLEGRSQ